MAETRIKRFTLAHRLFHLFLMLTFLLQTATGFSRMYIATSWGRKVNSFLGGYDTSLAVHQWAGVVMIAGFLIHTVYLLLRVNWKAPVRDIFGPDSLVPNLTDLKQFGQQVRWFFGLGPPPRFNRWTYWEKFDYWAVYWGLPLLAVTGLMLMYPIFSSRFLPGWTLNIALLLHRAEALLAVSYIFIVHFFVGHLRPSSFPMNEAMFSGSVPVGELSHEKPAWVERLGREGRLAAVSRPAPASWYRAVYFVFGYAVVISGLYLLINGFIYARYISHH
jgi:cytochrome b subunit of formate dehydrogenase